MEVYQGKSVFGGIAIGRISVHKKDEQQVKRVRIEDPEQEILRYRQAKQTAMEQLQGLYQKALKEVGEANAAIFEIHQMMLEDDDYNESVENIIRMQQVNAEYAVASTGDNFAQMFSAMDDDYMRARSADVKDISERVLSVLGGRAKGATGSEIRYSYRPDGTIGADQCRYGIILIRYHNYSCYHRIFVRQGYAPAQIAGDAKWHCFNLCYNDTEAKSPREEGSLFRFGNFDQPIDATNNVFDNFKDHATTEFDLAPLESKKRGHGQRSREKRRSRTNPALRQDSATANRPSTAIPTAM